jgi:nucleotide-binding universal stress UspA family protein
MYENILVAFDNSEYSKAALAKSSNWVKKHGGRIILVNAVYFDEEEFSIAPDQREKRFELGRAACFTSKEAVSAQFGIEIESLVCEGEAADIITEIAREKKADLIAMGTHGRRGLNRLIMGSVTSAVLVNSPVDVIMVRKPDAESSGTYPSILLPFDGSEFSKKALERACQLSKMDGSEVTVLYVIPRYEEMVGFFRTDSIRKSLSGEAEKIVGEATRIASGHGISVKTEIREGQTADEIVKTASRLKKHLIIMGTYGWRGINKVIMGSTTERVVMDAPCPVLAVK